MSETLTFGPEWLRALSSGNSVTSPPPSPGPKFKLAEFRYGKEEMLALFMEELNKPVELEHFASVAKEKSSFPMAFLPPTEEEQRTAMGSVNSNAVLKLMGRGGTRGGLRGARGVPRGRGRGDGGFMRQSSYEDTRQEGGFSRDPKRQSWDENRRGGFDPGRGRGYDPTLRSRITSDSTWDRGENNDNNWRFSGRGDEDDGGGWRISGSRSAEKTERWRGGRPTRGGTWRAPDSYRRENSYPDDEWQVARSGRARSWHERDDNRWSASGERLPEWSNDDQEDFDMTGTFDASGAFRSQKKENTDEGRTENRDSNENKSPTSEKRLFDSSYKESPTQSEEIKDEKSSKDKPLEEKAPQTKSTSPSPQPTEAKPHTPPPPTSTPPTTAPRQPSPMAPAPVQKESPPLTDDRKDEEQGIDHLEKAAENLVLLLDDEDEEKSEQERFAQQSYPRLSPATTPVQGDNIQWYYTDPQGKQQGPFTNAEMADWFKHGYFSMNLMIRRMTDEVFQPLGELIKSWGRVPFHAGPQPPALKSIPDHIKQQQQLLAQQQYQDLMRQHLIQQQFLHQQALLMQQQQLHQMQQMQQPAPSQQSPPDSAPPPQMPPPQSIASEPQRMDLPPKSSISQQQQHQRPQGLSVTSESIWGPSGPTQTSPSMMSAGPWSPANSPPTTATPSTPPVNVWDLEANNKSKVQSLQEIQRIEEEKERKTLEKERREAEARALQQKQQEEEERRRQQELLLQRQREEEEMRRQQEQMLQRQREEEERRRQQEEAERQRREQEEVFKKQQEESRRKQEEELRRKQETILKQQQEQQRQQLELQKRQQEQQRQQELQKRQQEEKQRMAEMRQQQQQALLRLQQQQQEVQRRKEIQKQMELQQKLQQKRQVSNGSLWGSTSSPAALSLAEIQQQQEERERLQRERQRLILEQQEREQQNRAAAAGWGEHAPVGPPPVKSLLEIQEEQARQQKAKAQNQQLSRSQPAPPSHNPLSSSVWGSNPPSLSSSWASGGTSGNVWGGGQASGKQPQSRFMAFAANTAEDEDEDDEDELFWDNAVKAAAKANPPPAQARQQQAKNKTVNSTAAQSKPAQAKKSNKDEESVRRLFQQHAAASADDFTQWCETTLRSMKATGVDIPTFIMFLKEVESPYEIHDYVKSYVGDTKEARDFAKEFIEKRKKDKHRSAPTPSPPVYPQQTNVWGAIPTQQSNTSRAYQQNLSAHSTDASHSGVVGNGGNGGESASSKKKKKKKMQKVDPSILGFSVNAAERVNMGEIQTLEDTR
ncbi:predicted protein [Nematostella vectensis]|uniref:GYF domain-containing protein n=1 Tax=Nematostella vectensis TaxID=45351 RepID=A7SSZ9_NEMVE|nr:predicted protein [Nematostella vectensis]|eukprot:XP_001625268.1 predicted protein [Nematostella vectensis]